MIELHQAGTTMNKFTQLLCYLFGRTNLIKITTVLFKPADILMVLKFRIIHSIKDCEQTNDSYEKQLTNAENDDFLSMFYG